MLEGRPGVGKTTVARRLADLLAARGVRVAGFVTEEIRESGRRVGFAVETFEGERAVLAHVDLPGPPRVSRYGVDLEAFERLGVPALMRAADDAIVVLDELGKMELASDSFRAAVADLYERPVAIVATVHVARDSFTEALKRREDVEVVRVSTRNRDELPGVLAARLLGDPAKAS